MDPPSSYAEQRYKDGLECARRATEYDQQGHFSCALTFYSETVEALSQACSMAPIFNPILPRVTEYARRAEEIRQYLATAKASPNPAAPSAKDQRYVHQIEYLVELAVMDDEKGQRSEAEKMYTSAIDLALQAQKLMIDEALKTKVKSITVDALGRLEQLKQAKDAGGPTAMKIPLEQLKQAKDTGGPTKDTGGPTAPPHPSILDQMPSPPKVEPGTGPKSKGVPRTGTKPGQRTTPGAGLRTPRVPLTSFLDADSDLTVAPKFDAYSAGPTGTMRSTSPTPGRRAPPHATATVGGRRHKGAKFTDWEIKVLRATTMINGVAYLPWSDADLAELRVVTSLPQEFKDPVGVLPLADKQKAHFSQWMRPHDICDTPKMVHLISSFTIKQSIIGDCSFIASLAVCADYERKFRTRLVTRLIHPQNRSGEPIINPNGKYLVSLNLNGCRRKVVIDDRLPMGRSRELLCSYSSNDDEFWISLIEKAYMKVMGGYDFPGSSSNIDLHALTGWIPERIATKNANDSLFKKLEQSLRKGSALITVATGPLSEAEAERAGLVSTHAYAVLNAIEIKGLQLLQLKNPWSHRRWKGNYSQHDRTHWTPELRRALNYDQTQALQDDNGVFWIDWKSLCVFYDVIYFNWRPGLFKHKSTIHDLWKPGEVGKDIFDISTNPQYSLKVNCSDQSATVWVLLSRHITALYDFANNEKFITLNIASSDGKRVYLPDNYVVQGIKINTPHYLAKLESLPRGPSTFTIIVSQLESLSTIYYTLRVYSTCEFVLTQVPNPYSHKKELKGEWRQGQKTSPKMLLTTSAWDSQILIKLRAPKELYVRIEMCAESPGMDFSKVDSGPLRPGFTVLEIPNVPEGTLAVTATTFTALPAKPVPFFVTLSCNNVFNFDYNH